MSQDNSNGGVIGRLARQPGQPLLQKTGLTGRKRSKRIPKAMREGRLWSRTLDRLAEQPRRSAWAALLDRASRQPQRTLLMRIKSGLGIKTVQRAPKQSMAVSEQSRMARLVQSMAFQPRPVAAGLPGFMRSPAVLAGLPVAVLAAALWLSSTTDPADSTIYQADAVDVEAETVTGSVMGQQFVDEVSDAETTLALSAETATEAQTGGAVVDAGDPLQVTSQAEIAKVEAAEDHHVEASEPDKVAERLQPSEPPAGSNTAAIQRPAETVAEPSDSQEAVTEPLLADKLPTSGLSEAETSRISEATQKAHSAALMNDAMESFRQGNTRKSKSSLEAALSLGQLHPAYLEPAQVMLSRFERLERQYRKGLAAYEAGDKSTAAQYWKRYQMEELFLFGQQAATALGADIASKLLAIDQV